MALQQRALQRQQPQMRPSTPTWQPQSPAPQPQRPVQRQHSFPEQAVQRMVRHLTPQQPLQTPKAVNIPQRERLPSTPTTPSQGTSVSAFPPDSPKSRGQDERQILRRLAGYLKHGSEMKLVVRTSFLRAAASRRGLSKGELGVFRSVVSQAAHVPEAALGDIHDEFIRFDFDGDGMIEEHEAYKLVKYHYREYLKQLSPDSFRVHLKWGSPEFMGFEAVRDLGKGSFGVVTLVSDADGNQFCIKTLPKVCTMTGRALNHDELEHVKEEYAIMRELGGDTRIAKVFDLFQDDKHIYLVSEPYFGGDMSDLVSKAMGAGIDVRSEDWWRSIFRQCFAGLLHMHRHAMMHCDIKEKNIMLKTEDLAEPQIVIIDYGLAQSFATTESRLCGTPGYIPPETWSTSKWYPKGDCFSMGVTMYQMLTNTVPNESGEMGLFGTGANSLDDVRVFTFTRIPPLDQLPDEYRELTDLLNKLLHKDQSQRWNADMVQAHPWLGGPLVASGVEAPAQPAAPPARSRAGSILQSALLPKANAEVAGLSAPASPGGCGPRQVRNGSGTLNDRERRTTVPAVPEDAKNKINGLLNQMMQFKANSGSPRPLPRNSTSTLAQFRQTQESLSAQQLGKLAQQQKVLHQVRATSPPPLPRQQFSPMVQRSRPLSAQCPAPQPRPAQRPVVYRYPGILR